MSDQIYVDTDGRRYILRPWFTKKDGTRVYARDHGKCAFKIYLD